ncbi:CIA30 family protein [Shimia sp. SDUM112013]|uniref:CIA30 family protein n=1 Tax=Shimia sp. SDUM112013 TaxID=3136160 RepID=UPI0032EB444C
MQDYTPPPPSQWEYLSDQVMGGVSTGSFRVEGQGDAAFVHLTGDVSTENRGGFIQVRTPLTTPLPETTSGLILRVRGNATRYFVHLRTSGTMLPWQYYQAGFDVTESWQEIRIPLSAFEPSGRLLRGTPKAQSIESVGFVAYGRDHEADLSARWIGIY